MACTARFVLTLFLSATICCGTAQTNARETGSFVSPEADAAETIHSTEPAIEPSTEFQIHSLPQIASLTQTLPNQDQGSAMIASEPFGRKVVTAPPNDILEKWTDLQSRIHSEQETLAACRSGGDTCPVAARRFLDIVELGRRRQGRARLGEINRAVNLSITPVSDWVQYGVEDFWSSPLATLNSEAGDCEDYAIVKYVALRELGVGPEDLRLVIVRDSMHKATHAVVSVRFNSEWLILDNETLIMANADDVRHYDPLFILGDTGARVVATATFSR